MANERLRILHVVTKMDRAGLETMLMNYYRHMDRGKIQFDFLTHRLDRGHYDDEIEDMGGKLFRMDPIRPQHLSGYRRKLAHFFASHPEYRIIHSHLDALSAFPLWAAKRAGCPVRIAHSHNTAFVRNAALPLRMAAKRLILFAATDFWGCSRQAMQFMFGKKLCARVDSRILPNAFLVDRFAYRPQMREEMRELLEAGERLVVGHVGRFHYQKNHSFLLDIFRELKTLRPESVLWLIGEGEEKTAIQEKANRLGLGGSVKFLGQRDDVPKLMQAMDVFLFPSRFEGFGNVLMEAQAAGLPCFASRDVIPPEAGATPLANFISLESPPREWAEAVLSRRDFDRLAAADLVRKAGYDVREQALDLERIYLEMGQRDG